MVLRLLISLALVAMTWGVYWQVGSFGFQVMDDWDYVRDNPHVLGGLSWDGFWWAWTAVAVGNWQPLTLLSYQLDASLFGDWAGGYHLVNVALHAANAAILFLLLWQMTGATVRSAVVAGLFAVHPLHVESVAWIAERKDVVSVLLGLLSISGYVGYTRTGRRGQYAAAWVAFLLSLLAKPMLVTLPCVLLLMDAWPLERLRGVSGRPEPSVMRRLVIEKLPFLGLTVLGCVAASWAQAADGAVRSVEALPVGLRVVNALSAYVMYLYYTVWPVRLSVFYPHPVQSLTLEMGLAAAGLLGAVTWLAARQWRTQPWMLVGWLWFLGTLVPVIGLVQVGNQQMADRYCYFPHVGLFVAMVWGVDALLVSWLARLRPIAVAGACVLIGVLAVRCSGQVSLWKDSITLLEHAVAVTGPSSYVSYNLGVAYFYGGRPEDAVRQFEQKLAFTPRDDEAHHGLASALVILGAEDPARRREAFVRAEEHLREALRLNPLFTQAYNDLGLLYLVCNEAESAVSCLQRAVELDPGHAQARQNLADARAVLGQVQGTAATPPTRDR
jgi:hypothetical protein